MENRNVISRACVALAALARVVGNSRWFGPTGACEALCSALRNHEADAQTVRFIVTAAGNLCIVNHNRTRFGMLGFCADLCRVMEIHISDADCIKACVSTTWKLCENDSGANPVSRLGPSNNETSKGEEIVDSTDVNLAQGSGIDEFSGIHSNMTNREVFAKNGAYGIIVKAIEHHAGSLEVTQAVFRSVAILCSGKLCIHERDIFGDLGMCSIVAKQMECFSQNHMITFWGSLAVRALAEAHVANRIRFFDCKMPHILIEYLNISKTNGSNQNIDAIISAMANLAEECHHNQSSFGSSGACEQLLEYLDQNYRSLDMCYLGLRALCCVVLGCEENILKISFSNAADILMTVMFRYPEEDAILANGLSLVSSLCTNKVGYARLSTNSIIKASSLVQNKLERSNDLLAVYGCQLVANLSVYPIWKEKFGQCGWCKTISTVLTRNLSSVPTENLGQNSSVIIILESCRAIVNLVTDNEPNKQKFLSYGTLELLTSSIESGNVSEHLSPYLIQAQNSLLGIMNEQNK